MGDLSICPQNGATAELLLDHIGTVVSADQNAALLFGSSNKALIGGNFFRDLAPAARHPGFFGRFLDVAHGAGHAEFTASFVLGEHGLRTEIGLTGEPGRHVRARIHILDSVERPADAAQLTVQRRLDAEEIDASLCEREPIHIPGTIQGHAALLVVDPATGEVVSCSANSSDTLGAPLSGILGRPADELIPKDIVTKVRELTARKGPQPLVLRTRLGAGNRLHEVQAHLHNGLLLIELEEAPEDDAAFPAATAADLQRTARAIRNAGSIAELAVTCAREVRHMTGFERVLIYRFDGEANGEVVGEDIAENGPEPLLGLHFPASDIPAQARALYRHSASRFVLDRDALPSPIISGAGGNQPVDLSFAQFRSLSPIHLEYQRNLGVNGSMSASIIVAGALWGLIIGHHRQPHYVPPDSRKAVEVVADILAVRIEDLESTAATVKQHRGLAVQTELLQRMAQSDDYVAALTGWHTNLLDLFGATGAFVARGESITEIGNTPSGQMPALIAWLRGRAHKTVITHHLGAIWPPAAYIAEIASGLLAVFVDPDGEHIIGWLKPEFVRTLTWGGDPNKPVVEGGGQALPRRSFERWTEEKRGQSESWPGWQVRIAETLALTLEGVILRQQRRIALLNATQAELREAIAQKELLAREIDHRVKNSLQIVASFLQLQSRVTTDVQAREAFSDTYARVMSVARVHDTLYQSDDSQQVDLGQTIARLCNDLADMGGQERTVDVNIADGVMTPHTKAVALSLIATELITNAFKHAGAGADAPRVEVSLKRKGDGIHLSVCDNGDGLPSDWSERTHRGLGMRMISAMLHQVGGHMETNEGRGACFHVYA